MHAHKHEEPKPETSTIDAALDAVRRGFSVINCRPGTKEPIGKEWQFRTVSDEAGVRKLWTTHVLGFDVERIEDYNIGISTDELLVLDVDVRDGKQGQKSFDELDIMHGLPETFTVRTASGGLHYYFRPRNPVRPSASKIGLHLDVKGWHGQVLGPGSVIDGKRYEIVKDLPIADAPEWLEEAAGRPTLTAAIAPVPGLELDTESAKRRAISFLDLVAPGQADGSTYGTAVRLGDLGISEDQAVELMAEHWNHKRNKPKTLEALQTKVHNAYVYRKQPVGCDSAQADFDIVPPANDNINAPKPKAPPKPQPIELLGDEAPGEYPDPLVEGLIDEGAAVLLVGAPKAGKSHAAYAIAHAVATGRPLAGRHVEAGGVLYIQYEGFAGMRSRRAALRIKHGSEGALAFWKATGNILHPAHQDLVVVQIKEAERRLGRRIALVVVDTVSAAAPGLKQNDAGEVSAALEAFKAKVLAPDRALLIIHHTPKEGTDPAGSYVFKANVDGVLRVEKMAGGVRKLIAADMRDHAEGNDLQFCIESVRVGTTRRGRPVDSAVALFTDFPDTVPPVGEAANILDIVRGAGGSMAVDKARLKFCDARRKRVKGVEDKSHATAFRRALKELKEDGHVTEAGGLLATK
jgi:KaiC/GvpD/RAD55 family RecA-like ATPase